MKIFFTIKALNGVSGGAERVLCVVASKLAERGHDVTIVSFDHRLDEPFYPLGSIVKRKVLGKADPKHKSTLPEIFSRMFQLRKIVHEEKPDIVIGFMHSIFVPLAYALIGSGTPVIASEHIVPQYYKERKLEYFSLIISGFFARTITVLSEPVRQLYPRILRKRMYVVPNPVSTYVAPGNIQKQKIILNVGRLDPQKDQKTLIDAFALLSPRYPDWLLRIVGEGPLRKDLEEQIEKLNLQHKIALPGLNKNIEEEYARAEIFAIPSSYESFGLVTAEALSASLPAVGFKDCPGTNEIIIDGQNGLLVKAENRTEGFAAALEKLMVSDSLRQELGRQGPLSVQKFQPDHIASIWENLITQTL